MTGRSTDRFAGKVAVVTGGGSGLGAAVALRLAREGARVVLADVDEPAARDVADEIGANATIVPTDVTRPADVRAMVETAEGLGGLHVLVLSAAIETRAPLQETSDEAWQQVLDVNLKGPFLCMRAGIPAMIRSGGGAVIALGSTLGAIGQPGYAAYCASKGALLALVRQAAIDYGPDIRINVLCPGPVDTPLIWDSASAFPDPSRAVSDVAQKTLLKRLGSPEDIARAALFLASDESGWITGTSITIDGGIMTGA